MKKRGAREKVSKPAASQEGERLNIRIPPELKEVAKELAQEEGRSVSNWILQMIRDRARERGKLH
jgi:predicted HicB family RNase H-like nuclease